jgi:peroxiredoxin family protein
MVAIMPAKKRKLAMVVESGTIDKIYCAFILGSTAVSMGTEVHMYFTFWGLQMLQKGEMEKARLPVEYQHMEESFWKKLEEMKYPTPYELLKSMKGSGLLHIYACTPTMEMFGVKKENLIPEVDKLVGAATFLDIAADADVSLFI